MELKDKLKQGIEAAVAKALADGALPEGTYPEVVLEVPPQKEFGDFSTNIAMQSARVARMNPAAIADIIIANMDYDWLEKAEKAGAGFINFFVKTDAVYDTLKSVLEQGVCYVLKLLVMKIRFRLNM